MVVLTLSLFYLSVAEVQQLDHRAVRENSTETPQIKTACACAADIAGSQNNYQLAVLLRELEAKLRHTEKQLEDLRGEVKGKNIHNCRLSIAVVYIWFRYGCL